MNAELWRGPRVGHQFSSTITWFEWTHVDGWACRLEVQPRENESIVLREIFGPPAGGPTPPGGVPDRIKRAFPRATMEKLALRYVRKTLEFGRTHDHLPQTREDAEHRDHLRGQGVGWRIAGFDERNADPIIRPRGRRVPHVVYAAVAAMLADGMTREEVATATNYSVGRVKQWIEAARDCEYLSRRGRELLPAAQSLLDDDGRTSLEIVAAWSRQAPEPVAVSSPVPPRPEPRPWTCEQMARDWRLMGLRMLQNGLPLVRRTACRVEEREIWLRLFKG